MPTFYNLRWSMHVFHSLRDQLFFHESSNQFVITWAILSSFNQKKESRNFITRMVLIRIIYMFRILFRYWNTIIYITDGGVQQADVPRCRHPSFREHRSPIRHGRRVLLRGDGLFLREDMEPLPAVLGRILSAVPGQGEMARWIHGLTPSPVFQCRDVRFRA